MITFQRLQLLKEMITQLVFLLDYYYLKEHYKLIVIDLRKQ